jgi:hypothetical protein
VGVERVYLFWKDEHWGYWYSLRVSEIASVLKTRFFEGAPEGHERRPR